MVIDVNFSIKKDSKSIVDKTIDRTRPLVLIMKQILHNDNFNPLSTNSFCYVEATDGIINDKILFRKLLIDGINSGLEFKSNSNGLIISF